MAFLLQRDMYWHAVAQVINDEASSQSSLAHWCVTR